MSKVINYIAILTAISGTLFLLSISQSFLVPIIWSIILAYFIITLSTEVYKLNGFRNFPFWVSTVFANVLFFIILMFFVNLIKSSIGDVIKEIPSYQERFLNIVQQLYASFGMTEPENFKSMIESINLTKIFTSFGSFFQNGAGKLGIILIYTLFLLLEYHTFEKKLAFILPDKKRRREVRDFLSRISTDLKTYLKIKTAVSCGTGVISYLILISIGVDFALFWALLIFMLNYIPTIGSVIAIMFPLVVTLVQFDGVLHFGIAAVLLITTQVAMGNILEPRLMGKSLNLSPFFILLSLSVCGKILGITGMFLCVPLMVILNLVLSYFESTRPIAILGRCDFFVA